ncbi:MAG TPA: hypothetical protein VLF41_03370 [Candidatus Nanoarchaeia archaeon]|nr:hypothetical protein [Candidatus Nanoarchaeia archaeon]
MRNHSKTGLLLLVALTYLVLGSVAPAWADSASESTSTTMTPADNPGQASPSTTTSMPCEPSGHRETLDNGQQICVENGHPMVPTTVTTVATVAQMVQQPPPVVTTSTTTGPPVTTVDIATTTSTTAAPTINVVAVKSSRSKAKPLLFGAIVITLGAIIWLVRQISIQRRTR